MSNNDRWHLAQDYVNGFEDAKNGINEHYEEALKKVREETEERQRSEAIAEYFDMARMLQPAYSTGYLDLLTYFFITEEDRENLIDYVEISTTETANFEYQCEMLYDLHFDNTYDEDGLCMICTCAWNEYETKKDIWLPFFSKIRSETGIFHMKYMVPGEDESAMVTRGEYTYNWMTGLYNRSTWWHCLRWIELEKFRRLIMAIAYTMAFSSYKVNKWVDTDDVDAVRSEWEDSMKRINEFWALDWDRFTEEFDKKDMWAQLHGDKEQRVMAFWQDMGT